MLIEIPYVFPINIPTNNERIIKRFGFTPAMLNQIKKFDCKKYKRINIKNIIIIDSIFFIVVPSFFFHSILPYFFQFFKRLEGFIILNYEGNE